jgi:hypothetical protein
MLDNVGAIVMGRTSFDKNEGDGGWGDSGPVGDTPCFVVTHHAPTRSHPSTFTFVTDGVASAIEQAKQAAGLDPREYTTSGGEKRVALGVHDVAIEYGPKPCTEQHAGRPPRPRPTRPNQSSRPREHRIGARLEPRTAPGTP